MHPSREASVGGAKGWQMLDDSPWGQLCAVPVAEKYEVGLSSGHGSVFI